MNVLSFSGCSWGFYLSCKPPQHLLLSPSHLWSPWAASSTSSSSYIISPSAFSQGIMGKGHSLYIWRENSVRFFSTFWIQRDERSEIVSLLCGCFACFDLHFYWFYRFFPPRNDFMGFSWWLALRDLKLTDYIGFSWWLFYWMNRDVFVAGTTQCESFWAHEICAPANKLLCHFHHPLKVPAKSKVTIKLLKQ